MSTRFPRVLAAARLLKKAEKLGDDLLISVATDAFDYEVESAADTPENQERRAAQAETPAPSVPRETISTLEPVVTQEAPDLTLSEYDDEQEQRSDDAGDPDSILLSRAGVTHVFAAE